MILSKLKSDSVHHEVEEWMESLKNIGLTWINNNDISELVEVLYTQYMELKPLVIQISDERLNAITMLIERLMKTQPRFKHVSENCRVIPQELASFAKRLGVHNQYLGYYDLPEVPIIEINCSVLECYEIEKSLQIALKKGSINSALIIVIQDLKYIGNREIDSDHPPVWPRAYGFNHELDCRILYEDSISRTDYVIMMIKYFIKMVKEKNIWTIILTDDDTVSNAVEGSQTESYLLKSTWGTRVAAFDRVCTTFFELVRKTNNSSLTIKYEPSLESIFSAVSELSLNLAWEELIDGTSSILQLALQQSKSPSSFTVGLGHVTKTLHHIRPATLRGGKLNTLGNYIGYEYHQDNLFLAECRKVNAMTSNGKRLKGLSSLIFEKECSAEQQSKRLINDYLRTWGQLIYLNEKIDLNSESAMRCESLEDVTFNMLISGKTGSGKTALALAIAEELSLPVVILQASTVRRSVVGSTEKLLMEFFNECELFGPLVVIIEDIELLLGNKKIDYGNDTNFRLNRLIGDGLSQLMGKPCLTIATTSVIDVNDNLDTDFVKRHFSKKYLVLLSHAWTNSDDYNTRLLWHYLRGRIAPEFTFEQFQSSILDHKGLSKATLLPSDAISIIMESGIKACNRINKGIMNNCYGQDIEESIIVEDVVSTLSKFKNSKL